MVRNEISGAVIDAAMKVHTALGPGLLESVYQKCLQHELQKRGLKVEPEVWLPVVYDGIQIEGGYKVDLLIEGMVIVELKVVEHLLGSQGAAALIPKAQRKRIRAVNKFNVVHLKDGIKRIVNSRPSASSAYSAVVG